MIDVFAVLSIGWFAVSCAVFAVGHQALDYATSRSAVAIGAAGGRGVLQPQNWVGMWSALVYTGLFVSWVLASCILVPRRRR